MRRFAFNLGVLLLLAGTLIGQTAEWKKHKNTDGNFTALFPGDPNDTVNKSEGGMQSHTLLARDEGSVYTVIYTSMETTQTVDDATFEVFKNAVFKELPKCDAGAAKPATPGVTGYIGHRYILSCDISATKVNIVGSLYWGRHYAYAVMVMFPSTVTEPAAAEKKFFESFSVIDPAK